MSCSVLIVDDEESVCTSIQMYLEDKGYEVCTAATVAGGLEALDRTLPDVLLADLSLPDSDGFHLITEALKRSSATAVIKEKNVPGVD